METSFQVEKEKLLGEKSPSVRFQLESPASCFVLRMRLFLGFAYAI